MNVIHVTTKPYSDMMVTIGRQRCADGTWFDNPEQGRLASRNSDHRLALVGTYHRFGLGYSEPGTWVNQGQDMPRLFTEEPKGYTYGLASCIAANPEMGTWGEIRRNEAAGLEHPVEDGDLLVTDRQHVFQVRLYRREFLALDYVGTWDGDDGPEGHDASSYGPMGAAGIDGAS